MILDRGTIYKENKLLNFSRQCVVQSATQMRFKRLSTYTLIVHPSENILSNFGLSGALNAVWNLDFKEKRKKISRDKRFLVFGTRKSMESFIKRGVIYDFRLGKLKFRLRNLLHARSRSRSASPLFTIVSSTNYELRSSSTPRPPLMQQCFSNKLKQTVHCFCPNIIYQAYL